MQQFKLKNRLKLWISFRYRSYVFKGVGICINSGETNFSTAFLKYSHCTNVYVEYLRYINLRCILHQMSYNASPYLVDHNICR